MKKVAQPSLQARPIPPALPSVEASTELVYAEFLLRRELGEEPDPETYCQDHPQLADRLRLQFEVCHAIDEEARSADGDLEEVTSPPEYTLLEQLGRGSMGAVYKAPDRRLGRIVALKFLDPWGGMGPPGLARFQAEAEILAQFQHPNVVQIHEAGQLDGRPYIALEDVSGGSLADRVATHLLAPMETSTLLELLARAIHELHRVGVLHRDLKSANVLLSEQGVPKVTDFGLAKQLRTNHAGLTHAEDIVGSPGYMAPEQAAAESDRIGPATDVYALGAILYEAVTGRPPFRAATLLATLEQVRTCDPVPPSRIQPDLSRDLETICLKCLEKDPSRRYPTALALADDLARFRQGRPIAARRVGQAERAWKFARRHPLVSGLAGLIVLLATALAVGGPIASLRVAAERDRAVRAERDAVAQFRESLIYQARAQRATGLIGHRYRSLEALAEAMRLRPSRSLQDDAVACLSLTDLHPRQLARDRISIETTVDFDPDLRRHATASPEGEIHIHDGATGLPLGLIPSASLGLVDQVLFSPDGRSLGVIHHHRGRLSQYSVWDVETGKELLRVPTSERWGSLAFDASGRFVAVVQKGTLSRFDLRTGEPSGVAEGIETPLSALAVHAGRLAASWLNETKVRIFDWSRGTVEQTLGHPAGVRSLAWSSDGSRLAAGCEDFSTYLWDGRSGLLVSRLEPHHGRVFSLQFNHSGEPLCTASWDETSRLFDARDGRLLVEAPGQALRFDSNDRRLAYRAEGTHLGIWDIEVGSVLRTVSPETRERSAGGGHHDVGFSPDGLVLAASSRDGTRIWNAADGRQVAHLAGERSTSVSFRPGIRPGGWETVTWGPEGVRLWKLQRGSDPAGPIEIGPPRRLDQDRNTTNLARTSWSPDGRFLAYDEPRQGRAILLDLDGVDARREFAGRYMINSLSLSPDGRWIAAGTWQGQGPLAWDRATGRTVADFPVTQLGASSSEVAFSPDGLWLLTSNQGELRYWRTRDRSPGPILPRGLIESMPGPLAFSPGDRLLAYASSRTEVHVLITGDPNPLVRLPCPTPSVIRALAFLPAGHTLAVATESPRILLWDLEALRLALTELGLGWPTAGGWGWHRNAIRSCPALGPSECAGRPRTERSSGQESCRSHTRYVVSKAHASQREIDDFAARMASIRAAIDLTRSGSDSARLRVSPRSSLRL